MQINKYIPHYQRIPSKLESKDLQLFQAEFEEKSEKLKDYLIKFDTVLIQ